LFERVDVCSLLRESAELLAILNTLVGGGSDNVIAARISSLLDKRGVLLEAVRRSCGVEVYVDFEKALESPSSEKIVVEALRKLHYCMLSVGCESNISIE